MSKDTKDDNGIYTDDKGVIRNKSNQFVKGTPSPYLSSGSTKRKGVRPRIKASDRMRMMGVDPLSYICTVMQDEGTSPERRLRIAMFLLPYQHSIESQVQQVVGTGDVPTLSVTRKVPQKEGETAHS